MMRTAFNQWGLWGLHVGNDFAYLEHSEIGFEVTLGELTRPAMVLNYLAGLSRRPNARPADAGDLLRAFDELVGLDSYGVEVGKRVPRKTIMARVVRWLDEHPPSGAQA